MVRGRSPSSAIVPVGGIALVVGCREARSGGDREVICDGGGHGDDQRGCSDADGRAMSRFNEVAQGRAPMKAIERERLDSTLVVVRRSSGRQGCCAVCVSGSRVVSMVRRARNRGGPERGTGFVAGVRGRPNRTATLRWWRRPSAPATKGRRSLPAGRRSSEDQPASVSLLLVLGEPGRVSPAGSVVCMAQAVMMNKRSMSRRQVAGT